MQVNLRKVARALVYPLPPHIAPWQSKRELTPPPPRRTACILLATIILNNNLVQGKFYINTTESFGFNSHNYWKSTRKY